MAIAHGTSNCRFGAPSPTCLGLDMGGRMLKAVDIDASGLVSRFAMNDRCAVGTGEFLEVVARP